MIVTLEDFAPGARFDGVAYTQARIEESAAFDGPWTALETRDLSIDPDPSEPIVRNFTTTLATLAEGWYRIVWIDPSGNEQPSDPVPNSTGTIPYTSTTAVREVLAATGQEAGTAAELDSQAIEEAISEAAAEINARIASRYTVPLTGEIPPLVEKLNRDIAAYLATLVYRRGDPIDPNDPVQKRYDRAQALLSAVQAGKAELPISTGPVAMGDADAEVFNPFDGTLFTEREFSLGPRYGRYPGVMPPIFDYDY